MIISHKHRFIFIHCRKVAGSSIAAYLSAFLGPGDLQLGAWEDSYERGVLPNRRAWQDLMHSKASKSLMRHIARKPSSLWKIGELVSGVNSAQKEKYKQFLGGNVAHPFAVDIKRFDPQAWSSYYKFCFVRNPYERAVSDYLWRIRTTGRKDVSFLKYLEILAETDAAHIIKAHNSDNWPMYTIDGRVAVDYVGRYEDLHSGMVHVCEQIELPFDHDAFPHAKKSEEKYSYRDWYGASERRLAEEFYKNELEYFGYEF